MNDPAATCDAYALGMEKTCPGVGAHCLQGEHCTATGADCAAAWRYDHDAKCCLCGAPMDRSGLE